jgi:diguanylate cyclase (GGDEF)-like protein
MSKAAESWTPWPRILIVEDDSDQRDLIGQTLELYFRQRLRGVVGVATGAECMAQDLPGFDAILMDYYLPDTTGLALLDQIVQSCDVPVIFVTAENVMGTAGEAIRRGAQDYIPKLGDYLFALPVIIEKNLRQYQVRRENERLQAELRARMDEIRVKNMQLEESLAKLRQMAGTDHLTGLCNRRAFAEALERSFGQAQRYGHDLTCAMCDLDHYKRLNDLLGHQVGDRILVTAADLIRSNLRSSDVAARYGGDEFVLLLPHTSLDLAVNVVSRIRQQLAAETLSCAQAGAGVTMSIGLSSLKANQPMTGDELISMADRALYAAKDAGKDRIVIFGQPAMPEEAAVAQ